MNLQDVDEIQGAIISSLPKNYNMTRKISNEGVQFTVANHEGIEVFTTEGFDEKIQLYNVYGWLIRINRKPTTNHLWRPRTHEIDIQRVSGKFTLEGIDSNSEIPPDLDPSNILKK